MINLLLVCIVLSTPAVSQHTREFAKKNNVSGKWHYVTSAHWHKGSCPPPRKGKGLISIKRKGSKVTLQVLSGLKCSPKGICTCPGTIKGKKIHCSKTMKVDNEGGKANNTFHLIQKTETLIKGTVKSWYKHPSGFKCTWGFKVTLKKK